MATCSRRVVLRSVPLSVSLTSTVCTTASSGLKTVIVQVTSTSDAVPASRVTSTAQLTVADEPGCAVSLWSTRLEIVQP